MKTKFIFRLSRVFWFLLKLRKKKKFFFCSVETVGRARLLLFGYGAACSHLPYAFDGTANQKFFGPHPACPSYTRHPPFQTRCRYIYIYLVNIYIYTHTHTLSYRGSINISAWWFVLPLFSIAVETGSFQNILLESWVRTGRRPFLIVGRQKLKVNIYKTRMSSLLLASCADNRSAIVLFS